MKQLLATSLTVFALATLATPAQAWCCRRHCCVPCCPPPCCTTVAYVDKVVTCYRTEWREQDVPCQVVRAIPREVIQTHQCTVMVPTWTDVKKTCTVYKTVPVEVWKDVTCCRLVPVTVTDPCTGCCYTSCKPTTYVQKVKCIQCQLVAQPVEYTCKVCSYHPEARTYQTRCIVCDYKTETIIVKKRYCVAAPYTTTVKVAVPVPCAPVCCK